ncbi:MAG: transposase [Panacagrimonas sp.]
MILEGASCPRTKRWTRAHYRWGWGRSDPSAGHSEAFKVKVVAACRRPGVLIASVALSHGLNANLLRRWIHEREGEPAKPQFPALAGSVDAWPSFVPLAWRRETATSTSTSGATT